MYLLLKLYARLAIRIFCRHIRIRQPQLLKSRGPLLLAANHPNSFLDGILLTTLFENDIYSLARGDAFKHPRINRFLRWLRLLPVYRTSEGVENLGHNYTTFASCRQTFKKEGIVLIFSEGRCENEWHFRPLKKGTARLALSAWEDNIPLQVLPVAFNYSSFKKFGKTVHIDFGAVIQETDIDRQDAEGKQMLQFNQLLRRQLHPLVYEIAPNDRASVKKQFGSGRSTFIYVLLFLPAVIGLLLHAPLFYPVKWFTKYRFCNSGHYDSVIHSLLMLLYPLYLLLAIIIAANVTGWWSLLVLPAFPFTAWAWVQWSEVLE